MGKAARKTALLKAWAREPKPFERVEVTDEMRQEYPHLMHCSAIYANHKIEAQIFRLYTGIGGVWQVNMIRHGDIAPLSWEEIQAAVHELYGPEVTAVEIYPPIEYEWQTTLNLRVIWVLPHTWKLPFGLHVAGAWGKPA